MTKTHQTIKLLSIVSWIFIPPLFGILSVILGQDANWDLKNYHYYNPYSFLNGRMDFDVLPSQVANFYNPLLYVPYYHAINLFPPRGVGFFLGWIQGFNFPLILAIARQTANLTGSDSSWKKEILCFCIATTGMLGAGNIAELGTMFSDNILSLLILSSLLFVLYCMEYFFTSNLKTKIGIVISAGFLTGAAAGFKQPAAIFAVGICASFFVISIPFLQRFFLSFFYGTGVLSGIALTGGFWLYEMWVRFKNPLFPYFNLFFLSPMAVIGDYRDLRFIPGTIGEVLISPFFFGLAPYELCEVPFRDFRIPVLYVLLLFLLVYRLSGFYSPKTKNHSDSSEIVYKARLSFFFTSVVIFYLVWIKLFGIFRYVLIIELLAPLALWLILEKLFDIKGKYLAAATVYVFVLVTMVPADFGRVSWEDDFFGAKIPEVKYPENTIVIMTGKNPTSYLIPLFNEKIRFVRIQSYFTSPTDTPNGFDLLMKDIISAHTGQIYVLFRSYENIGTTLALDAYDLVLETESCKQFKPRIDANIKYPLYFCPVYRK